MFWEEMTVNHDVAGSVPVVVACRIASARYTRLALLALGATPLDKTTIDRFICANLVGGAKQNPLSNLCDNMASERCVVMGDFNMTPDDKLLAPIFERMTDTAKGFCDEKFSFPSDAPDIKIDYIFVSRDAKVLSADIPSIVVSDHRPYVAHVEF